MSERIHRATLAAIGVAACAVCVAAADPVINEFLARNQSGLVDATGERSDWIEVYNPSASPVTLTGWHLTDNPAQLTKWTFPTATVAAGGYLLVFASGSSTSVVSGQLHANFKLDGDGEYLALVRADGTTVAHQYAPEYPEQFDDVSYGILADRVSLGFFSTPTPGAVNTSGLSGVVAAPVPSVPSGCFTQAFTLAASSSTTGAVIRYASGGALPTESSPVFPPGGLAVADTVQLRVQAFASGRVPSAVATWTYFLLASELRTFSSDLPIVVVDTLGTHDITALEPKQPGVFAVFEPGADGRTRLTRAASVVTRAGLRRRGESTLRPIDRKPNLGVEAWRDDGDDDRNIAPLDLPPESDWVLHAPYDFDRALVRNSFVFRTARAMGEYASRDRFVEVFLNYGAGRQLAYSDYVGVYIIVERIKRDDNRVDIAELTPADNAEPAISGGYIFRRDKADPEFVGFTAGGVSLQYLEPDGLVLTAAQKTWLTGYLNAFKAALDGANFRDPVLGYAPYIDRSNWLNNHILNLFTENVDWSTYSTYFYKDRGGPIHQGPVWDSDRSIDSVDGRDDNPERWLANDGGGNTALFTTYWWGRLFQDPDFWQAWIDRWDKLRRDNGPLSDAGMVGLLNAMSNTLAEAQVRNFAKWGTPPRGGWTGEMNVVRDWVLRRGAWIDAQFIDRPEFSPPAGWIQPGTYVTLSVPAGGAVYYTLDGADPRAPGGAPAASAVVYTGPVLLSGPAVIRTRAWNGTTWINTPDSRPWSPPNAAVYAVTNPTLAVTEVMVHPRAAGAGEPALDREAFEFVEIRNTGAATASLLGVRLTGGVDFDFTTGAIRDLAPGAYALAVGDTAAFAARYPAAAARVAGAFGGSLDNGGEELTLLGPVGDALAAFTYNDARGWPLAANGAGHSLVPRLTTPDGQAGGALDYGGNWRASAWIDGSPGDDDPDLPRTVVLNEVVAHTDIDSPPYDSNDAIELFNAAATNVAIGGWYLSDDPDDLKKWAIPAGRTLAAGGFAAFDEMTGFHNPIASGFGLDKAGEQVLLSCFPAGTPGRVVDEVRFKAQENGVSLARSPDGGPWWYIAPISTNAANAAPTPQVALAELMVHPRATAAHPEDNTHDEYIKLYNATGAQADLWNADGPWRLDGGVAFTFPPFTSIPAGGALIVVPFDPTQAADVAAFVAAHGLAAAPSAMVGPWSGKLSNRGERLALERPVAADIVSPDTPVPPPSWCIVDEAIYATQPPWPTAVQSNGNALVRLNAGLSGNEPSNWAAQPASPTVAAPRILIVTPMAGSTVWVPSTTEVEARVLPELVSGAVHRVEFVLNGAAIGADSNAPYTATLPYTLIPTAGVYRLRADLVDDAGTHPSVEITLLAEWTTRIRLTAPASAQSLVSPFALPLAAEVAPDHLVGAVHEVRFLRDGAPFATLTSPSPSSPYTYTYTADSFDLPPTATWNVAAALRDDFGWSTSAAVRVYAYTSAFDAWSRRMKIALPGYTRPEALEGFQALVRLSEALPGFRYADVADAAGGDLRFADASGTNVVIHEVETWRTNGVSAVWVRVPRLVGTNTFVWAYWGNPAAAVPPAYTTNGAVWTGHGMVLHLAESAGNTARDASRSGRDGLFGGSTTQAWGQEGAAGAAVSLANRRTFIEVGGGGIALPAAWTLSVWFRDLWDGAQLRSLGESLRPGLSVADRLGCLPQGKADLSLYLSDAGFFDTGYDLAPPADAWQQLSVVSEGGGIRYYHNARPVGAFPTNTVTGTLLTLCNTPSFLGQAWAHVLDELRYTPAALSTNRLWAAWQTVASNGAFTAYGAGEDQHPTAKPDADGDGLLDAWEQQHFGGDASPAADADGDGMDNEAEFIAGTDPTNAASVFAVDLRLSNGAVWLSFPALSAAPYGPGYARYYALDRATNLPAPWVGMPGLTNIHGQNQLVTHTNPAPAFYRGRVWLEF